MPKFLIHGTYSAEGLKGLQKDKASGRRRALTSAIEALGGKMESFYYTLGAEDVVVVVDVPSTAAVAAMSIAASSSGLVRVSTTPLLTVEEVDEALGIATAYRAPGQ